MSTSPSTPTDDPTFEPPPPASGGWNFFVVLILVAAGGFFLASLMNMSDQPLIRGPGLIGTAAPAIRAQGWFNGPAIKPEDLEGKVVVVDAWAFWCGPCRREAPHLLELYEEFAPKGVVFVGLTSEGKLNLDESRKFVEDLRIPWSQGYGAVDTLVALKAEFIPQLWVIDPAGKIVWDQSSPEEIEVTLRKLVP